MMKKSQTAYFTVEAALILPFTLGVIVFLIYMMFYQYDRCLIEQDIGILALRGTLSNFADKERLLQEMQEQETKISLDKFVALQRENTKFRLSGNLVIVNGGGKVITPFPDLSFLSGQGGWQIYTEFRNQRISPALFVRTCAKLLQ